VVNLSPKFEGFPLDSGVKLGGVVFDFLHGAVSGKWCKIEPTSQLISNRKSSVGCQFLQKLMTLNDLER